MSLIPLLPTTAARSFAAVGLDRDIPSIRRTPDGEIDFGWYLLRAKRLRTESYADVARSIGRAIGGMFSGIAKALRERRQRQRAWDELQGLDDRSLRDLGLNRAGIAYAIDHGREDVPQPANINDKLAQTPRVA
jgi:uncharacterized protein YjiS (DUF1127 family)